MKAAGQGNVTVVRACIATAWRSHSKKIEIRLRSHLISVLYCPAIPTTLGEGLTTFHFQNM
jgi:hypothetical protein